MSELQGLKEALAQHGSERLAKDTQAVIDSASKNLALSAPPLPTGVELEVFDDMEPLGKGESGVVLAGCLRPKGGGGHQAVLVAIKTLQTSPSGDSNEITLEAERRFRLEGAVHYSVSHTTSGVVEVYGMTERTMPNSTQQLMLVTELMPCTLADLLYSGPGAFVADASYVMRLKLLEDVASSVLTLHTHNPVIVHGDLQAVSSEYIRLVSLTFLGWSLFWFFFLIYFF